MQDDRITRTAFISTCGVYRYILTRCWKRGFPWLCFIMLNPSIADAYQDDPTIKKLYKYTNRWGFGGFIVVNLFAYRATHPEEMKGYARDYLVGPLNDQAIREAVNATSKTICAWGAHGTLYARDSEVVKLVGMKPYKLYQLKKSGDTYPRHPLYLKDSLDYVRLDPKPYM